MKKKAQDSLLICVVAGSLALTLAHCSGCSLFIPEGEMTMEVSDEVAE
jgi:hypothetical protein